MAECKRRTVTFIAAFVVIAVMFCALIGNGEAHAAATASGTCGENVSWALDDEGTLTISGTGAMTDYTDPTTVPWWKDYHSSIKKIVIEDGVTSISSGAFCQTAATSVDIPASVQSIGNSAFAYCTALTNATIPEGLTCIPNNLFAACTALTTVTIPSTVTSIGENAFHSCAALTSVNIPAGVTSIGANAFYGCKALTGVTIPEGVTEIAAYTFYECSGLTDMKIPDNVSKIGAYAFYGCTGLKDMTVPGGVTSIEDYTFHLCTSLASVSLPATVTTIGKDAFSCCTSLTSISLPSGLTSIGNMAFWKSGLTSIAIPAGVTTIPENAFNSCTSLVNVSLPENLTAIGFQAFCSCSSLTDVVIPSSVTTIGSKAFLNCNALKTIYIPSSVTTISTTEYSDSPFYMCSSDLVIYCGASSKQTGWGDYWNYRSSSAELTVKYGYTREEYTAKIEAIAQALKVFVAYSDYYFNPSTAEKPTADVSAATVEKLAPYSKTNTGLNDLYYAGQTLAVNDGNVTLREIFLPTGSTSAEGYTFTVLDSADAKTGTTPSITMNGSFIVVSLPLNTSEFAKDIYLNITEENTGKTLTISAFDYAYDILNESEDVNLQNLVRAMYLMWIEDKG